MTKPLLFLSDYSKKHDTGPNHPECAARIEVLEELFADLSYDEDKIFYAHAADLDQILLAHSEDYVFDLQDIVPDRGLFTRDNETIFSPDSYDAALYAAGAACQAVDTILSQDCGERPRACADDGCQKAFCAIRPPGHHAEPTHELGFCLFNNIFIAARHAQEAHGLEKIAIVDFDVHHGNGTETMSRAHNKAHPDKPILYISSHAYPLFPMTGDPADNNETLLNIRLPDQCESDMFKQLYEEQVFPKLEDFAPQLLLLSAGFDAHRDDPLAPINLQTEDYGWLTQRLCAIADRHCEGRVVSVLEGGYNLDALKASASEHLRKLR